jgi:membrane protein DedA with SNARE-associated domain
MHWQRFLTFNVLGAATWVLVIASLGYFFGGRLPGLVHTMRTLNLVLLALLVLAALFLGK